MTPIMVMTTSNSTIVNPLCFESALFFWAEQMSWFMGISIGEGNQVGSPDNLADAKLACANLVAAKLSGGKGIWQAVVQNLQSMGSN